MMGMVAGTPNVFYIKESSPCINKVVDVDALGAFPWSSLRRTTKAPSKIMLLFKFACAISCLLFQKRKSQKYRGVLPFLLMPGGGRGTRSGRGSFIRIHKNNNVKVRRAAQAANAAIFLANKIWRRRFVFFVCQFDGKNSQPLL
jgi:hypothetical protein